MKNIKLQLLFIVCLALLIQNASAATTQPYCANGSTTNTLAPWYCSQINQAVASVWYEWEPIAMIAVVLAFLIGTMMLILGIALQNERLRNFATAELYEAVATALIVLLFLLISAILFGIAPSFVTGPIDPYNTSLTYISQTINVTQYSIKSLYNIILVDSYYGTITVTVSVGKGASATRKALSSLASLVNPLAQLITSLFIIPASSIAALLLDGLLALTAEFYLILFFMYVAIPIFLIPGIIFRTIFPLRGLGGMMIAMAIAFYLIMPILFSVAYALTNQSVIQNILTASEAMNINGRGTLAQTNAISPASPLILDLNMLESAMSAYFLSILFYPSLIIALTYFSMVTIADFIGGISRMTGRISLL